MKSPADCSELDVILSLLSGKHNSDAWQLKEFLWFCTSIFHIILGLLESVTSLIPCERGVGYNTHS